VRVDVLFGAAAVSPADVAGRVVAVIDVLRASTTIATALDNGARGVVPCESADEVIRRSKSFERRDVRLAGERRAVRVPGFDFGNSPAEFSREAIEGRTILMSTTNGTPALVAAQGARDVVVASYVNFSPALAFLRAAARGGLDVTIIAAGRERYFALEDAACAGRYARGITRRLAGADISDAAQACMLLDRQHGDRITEMLGESEHGRALVAAGFGEDLPLCAAIDAHPVVPVYLDRQIVKLGPDWER
jgi:2-phosphosulfolactate phosphatase